MKFYYPGEMDILIETPWWVYVLFIGLLAIGLRATKPRTISLYQLLLLPGIFTVWNVGWLAHRLQGHFSPFIFWVIGLGVGSFLGWLSVRSWKVSAHREQKTVSLPGTRSTLVLILLVFAIRYFFIYHYEVYPTSAPHLFIADALISGTITGVFVGRAIELYNKWQAK